MEKQTISVRVPATVGNFGSAAEFGTLALDASLNVKVSRRRDGHVGVRYFGENGERVPRDRTNLVVRAMEAALHLRNVEFTGADLEIFSSVPVAVGLGSSTAAVLAGLTSANLLYRLGLDEKTIFDLAGVYEHRAGNLRAAWLGGFVACVEKGSDRGRGEAARKLAVYQRTMVPEDLVLHVVVPQTVLVRMPLTSGGQPERGGKRTIKKSRTHAAAKEQNAVQLHRAAALSEFFVGQDKGIPFEPNVPLPPTCEKNVPGLEEALQIRTPGLLSVFLCGSGPAVGVFGTESSLRAVDAVREAFARNCVASTCYQFRPTNVGALDWNSPYRDITLPATRGLSDSLPKTNLLPV